LFKILIEDIQLGSVFIYCLKKRWFHAWIFIHFSISCYFEERIRG